jgi:hypothetical protein
MSNNIVNLTSVIIKDTSANTIVAESMNLSIFQLKQTDGLTAIITNFNVTLQAGHRYTATLTTKNGVISVSPPFTI